MPLDLAFIDLTKAFDLVSREGLFKILPKIGCPPKLQSLIESFHTDTKGTVQCNDITSEPFDIHSGVKQGCVLAPTLFGIFFALLLKHGFGSATVGIYLHTRSDGSREVLIRDMLFADDAAVATHMEQELQTLMDSFSKACKDFGLTISLKKTNVLGQDVEAPPSITIDDYELEVVNQFTYLGSTVCSNLSLDAELNKRIGNAATTLARLTTRVWGVTPNSLSRQRWQCTMPVSSAHCCTGVGCGRPMPSKRRYWMPSIWGVSAAYLASHGRT